MINDVKESNPEVGSSKTITCGSEISSYAMQTRFFYPPEIPFIKTPPTNVSRHF